MAVEGEVAFDGPDGGTGFEEGGGEGAETGSDLDHGVEGGDLGEFEGFAHDVAIDEEVLAEGAFGVVAEAVKEIAGGGGGERHGG